MSDGRRFQGTVQAKVLARRYPVFVVVVGAQDHACIRVVVEGGGTQAAEVVVVHDLGFSIMYATGGFKSICSLSFDYARQRRADNGTGRETRTGGNAMFSVDFKEFRLTEHLYQLGSNEKLTDCDFVKFQSWQELIYAFSRCTCSKLLTDP